MLEYSQSSKHKCITGRARPMPFGLAPYIVQLGAAHCPTWCCPLQVDYEILEHVHAHTHTHTHTHIHIHTHTYIHTYMHTYIHTQNIHRYVK